MSQWLHRRESYSLEVVLNPTNNYGGDYVSISKFQLIYYSRRVTDMYI